MGEAIGDILPLAIGVAISPMPIIAIVLILGTPRAGPNGLAFAAGWLAALSAVGTIMLLGAGEAPAGEAGEPATWASVLKLLLGVLLLLLAVRIWTRRPKNRDSAEVPGWMQSIDTFSPAKSLGAGALLGGANPKNLALTVAAAAGVAQLGLPGGGQALALGTFVVLGSLSILAPVGAYLVMGSGAKKVLDGVKAWMTAQNAAIMTVLFLVLGAKLIGDAISGFGA